MANEDFQALEVAIQTSICSKSEDFQLFCGYLDLGSGFLLCKVRYQCRFFHSGVLLATDSNRSLK